MPDNKKKADEKGGTDDIQKQMQTLVSAITALNENQTKLQGNFTAMVEKLDGLGNLQGKQSKDDDLDDEDDDLPGMKDADLEGLSRSQFLNVILKQVNKGFDQIGKRLDAEVGGVKKDLSTKDLKAELIAAANKHKDFKEWGPEIKTLMGENPKLSIERAYVLARTENPDKAGQMDEKYATPPTDDAGGKPKSKGGFGGLTPTSGSVDDKPESMDLKQASEAAYDEIFGDDS